MQSRHVYWVLKVFTFLTPFCKTFLLTNTDIPRHTPISIPAMLFKTFIKTTLQSIAAIIPIVTPIIILLLFISFILHKFLFIKLLLFLLNHLKILQCLHNCTFFIFWALWLPVIFSSSIPIFSILVSPTSKKFTVLYLHHIHYLFIIQIKH